MRVQQVSPGLLGSANQRRHLVVIGSVNKQLLPVPQGFKERVAASFESRAASYDSGNVFHAQLADSLLRRLAVREGDKALDVACGTGMVALPLARAVGRGGRVVGLDLSRGMLAMAAAKAQAEGMLAPQGPLELLEQDADAASFPPGSFDVITCSAALPFLPDTPRTLAMWHSWLRPGEAGIRSSSSPGVGAGSRGADGGVLAFNAFAAPNTPEFGLFLHLLKDRHGLELEDPCERLGSEQRCAEAMATAGFVDVQVVREEFDDTRPRPLEVFVESWWRQCAGSPFAPLDALLRPEQVEALRQEWVVQARASAAQRLVGGSVVNRPVTFVVTGRRP